MGRDEIQKFYDVFQGQKTERGTPLKEGVRSVLKVKNGYIFTISLSEKDSKIQLLFEHIRKHKAVESIEKVK